ncbi:MAG: hypothetical protein JO142_10605, partial [Burkholderiales bacterium]|nr:hypothetical protein [Burkholderiales bacterium]
MEHLREWLVSPGVAAQLADDGLLKLHASDAVLRRLAEDALGELLEASTQLAKTKLVLNNLAPFSTLLGETYQGRIVQATRDTNQNPAERRCIWQGVEALLYWHKVRFLCSFMKDQRQAALPWSEIRPHVEFIFDANAKRRAADAKSKQGLIALKQQLASLVLLSRSLSSGLHGRQALIAARIADHFAAHTLIGQGRAGSVTHGRGVNSTMVDATLPLLPTQPAVSVFYGLTKNVQALVKLEEDIKQTGALPEWLDGLTVPEVMMVTKQLKARWSGKQLKRRAERRAIDGRIAVVHGMAEIGEQLTPMRYKHPSRRDAISDEE